MSSEYFEIKLTDILRISGKFNVPRLTCRTQRTAHCAPERRGWVTACAPPATDPSPSSTTGGSSAPPASWASAGHAPPSTPHFKRGSASNAAIAGQFLIYLIKTFLIFLPDIIRAIKYLHETLHSHYCSGSALWCSVQGHSAHYTHRWPLLSCHKILLQLTLHAHTQIPTQHLLVITFLIIVNKYKTVSCSLRLDFIFTLFPTICAIELKVCFNFCFNLNWIRDVKLKLKVWKLKHEKHCMQLYQPILLLYFLLCSYNSRISFILTLDHNSFQLEMICLAVVCGVV